MTEKDSLVKLSTVPFFFAKLVLKFSKHFKSRTAQIFFSKTDVDGFLICSSSTYVSSYLKTKGNYLHTFFHATNNVLCLLTKFYHKFDVSYCFSFDSIPATLNVIVLKLKKTITSKYVRVITDETPNGLCYKQTSKHLNNFSMNILNSNYILCQLYAKVYSVVFN